MLQIRILCGVEHDDLKMLLQVSKTFRDAVSDKLILSISFEF